MTGDVVTLPVVERAEDRFEPSEWWADDAGLGASVRGREVVVAGGVERLSPGTRHLLEVAAVFGPSFSVTDLAAVLAQPAGGLLGAVHEAIDAGVLVPTPDALTFRHEMVRQIVYDGLPNPLRAAIHRQIGGLLLDRGTPEAAATHLVQGAEPGDSQALAGLDQAARRLGTSAPQWAAELALHALHLTRTTDDERLPRAATAVESLIAAGRLGEAAELVERTVPCHRRPPRVATARLRLARASILLMGDRAAEAATETAELLSEPGLPADLGAAAEVIRLLALVAEDDRPEIRRRAEAILAGSEGAGDDATLAGALTALSAIAWSEGRVADAVGLVRAAATRVTRGERGVRCPYPCFALAAALTALGELDEADLLISAMGEDIESSADTLWTAAPAVLRARVHLAAGRLDAAVADAEAGLGAARELGTAILVPAARAVLASVALLRGDVREAARQLDRDPESCSADGRRPFAGRGWAGAAISRWAEARLAEAEGGPARVVGMADGPFDELMTDRRLLIEEPAAGAWLVRVALAAGDRVRAEAAAAAAARLADENGQCPSLVAAAAHAQGLFVRDPALLERAAAGHRQPWARASALEDAGVVLGDAGDREGARTRLEAALAAYEEVGADRDVSRVRARLRAVGVRRRHWNRGPRPVSGWASLTETELNVAELVAEGLTNPQVADRMFLSRHTIDFHLRHIFRKLDIDSRVALARLELERRSGLAATSATPPSGRAIP